MKFASYVAVFCLIAAPAFASPHLTKSSPANGTKIKSPHRVVLTFNEALEPAFSGALLLDSDGRNLSGEPVKVSGRVITLSPAPLEPGPYTVSWHAVGHEGKRLEGRIQFSVRP